MKFLVSALIAAFCLLPVSQAAAEEIDMQLVLAIDVSSSVNYDEYNLQMRGYAAAFRDAMVIEAIEAGQHGRISVAATHWAGFEEQQTIIGWQIIANETDAENFAALLDGAPRSFPFGGTAIAGALEHAYSLFSEDPNQSSRQVIDISGDGVVSIGPSPEAARDRIVAAGVIINGLPILTDERALDVYYEEKVVGGIGSFVEPAASYDDFARAITEKLAREIRGLWQGV